MQKCLYLFIYFFFATGIFFLNLKLEASTPWLLSVFYACTGIGNMEYQFSRDAAHELCHEKTGSLHMRKQRRIEADQRLCFC